MIKRQVFLFAEHIAVSEKNAKLPDHVPFFHNRYKSQDRLLRRHVTCCSLPAIPIHHKLQGKSYHVGLASMDYYFYVKTASVIKILSTILSLGNPSITVNDLLTLLF